MNFSPKNARDALERVFFPLGTRLRDQKALEAPIREARKTPGLTDRNVLHVGQDQGLGSLIAVQGLVTPDVFLSSQETERWIRNQLELLKEQGLIVPGKTVLVFPEIIGLGLIFSDLGLNQKFLTHPNLAQAHLFFKAITSGFGDLAATFLARRCDLNLARVLICDRADEMAADYQRIFGSMAKDYGCYVVAGSAVLPSPRIENGILTVERTGRLRNVTVVFNPDGSPDPNITSKVFLTAEEQRLLEPGKVAELPVYRLNLGGREWNLGVIICADAWFQETFSHFQRKADILAVPIFGGGWDQRKDDPWKGYSGQPAPRGVDPNHPGNISQEEAYRLYKTNRYPPDKHVVEAGMRGAFFGATSFKQIGGGRIPHHPFIEQGGGREYVVVWLQS